MRLQACCSVKPPLAGEASLCTASRAGSSSNALLRAAVFPGAPAPTAEIMRLPARRAAPAAGGCWLLARTLRAFQWQLCFPGCRRAFVTRPGGQAGRPLAAGLMLPGSALPQVPKPYSSFAVSFLSLNLDLVFFVFPSAALLWFLADKAGFSTD